MSVGVTIAAAVIYVWPTDKYPWSKYVDPSCTLLFSILVCMTCKKTLGNCIYILMEGSPEAIDTKALYEGIERLGEGVEVHDFHVWSLSRGKYAMTARVRCNGNPTEMLERATQVCQDFGIDNSTLQIEDMDQLSESFAKNRKSW